MLSDRLEIYLIEYYDMIYIYVCVCVCVCVIQVGHALIKNLLKNFFFFGVPYFIVKNSLLILIIFDFFQITITE